MVNRKYKDRVFCKLFGENKANALSLYNAVNGTSYTDSDLVHYEKVDGAVYMGMHNDVSFYLSTELNLWEHQSTYDSNLPFRMLIYYAEMLEKRLSTEPMLAYRRGFRLHTPRFYVFYNGARKVPEESELKLTDLMHAPERSMIDLRVKMLDINSGRNAQILEKCNTLSDYSKLVQYVREYREQGLDFNAAVDSAIERALREDLLPGFLASQVAEVKDMIITEYDEDRVHEIWRLNGYDEGREEGREGRDGRTRGSSERSLEACE